MAASIPGSLRMSVGIWRTIRLSAAKKKTVTKRDKYVTFYQALENIQQDKDLGCQGKITKKKLKQASNQSTKQPWIQVLCG